MLDVGAVMAGVSGLIRRLLGEDIELVVECDPGLAPVQADATQLEQVLLNLAVNARDAMPTGGQLVVSLYASSVGAEEGRSRGLEPGPHLVLRVRDTGVGMDEWTRTRMFDPFFTTKGNTNTGLGLSTVYEIVTQLGGAITVVSRMLLETCGYRVLEAEGGEAALEIFRGSSEPIHIVLTDLVMRGIGGVVAARRMRELRPGLAIVFVTGYSDDAALRHGVDASVKMLRKPYEPDALLAAVRRALDESRSPGQ